MKVQCDVCNKVQATVMCCADEAALCSDCDTLIHAANKLASKHQRVPLLYPEAEDSPSCDICQEKTGYFFCLEDRALLCRTCDFSIHSTNAMASNHKRFLVTGVRVALAALSGQDLAPAADVVPVNFPRPAPTPTQLKSSRLPTVVNNARQSASTVSQQVACSTSPMTQVASLGTKSAMQQAASLCPLAQQGSLSCAGSIETLNSTSFRTSPSLQKVSVPSGRPSVDWGTRPGGVHSSDVNLARLPSNQKGGGGVVRRSSISEYLTETIPGWKVDELLNCPDMGSMFYFPDYGKADTQSSGDLDWAADLGILEEEMLGESPAEVPSFPSPPTASGFSRPGRFEGFAKRKRLPDLSFLSNSVDILVVPDTGGHSSPTSPRQKRRRACA